MITANMPAMGLTLAAVLAAAPLAAPGKSDPVSIAPPGLELSADAPKDAAPAKPAAGPEIAPDPSAESVGEPAEDAPVDGEPSAGDPVPVPEAGDEPPDGGAEAPGSAEELDAGGVQPQKK